MPLQPLTIQCPKCRKYQEIEPSKFAQDGFFLCTNRKCTDFERTEKRRISLFSRLSGDAYQIIGVRMSRVFMHSAMLFAVGSLMIIPLTIVFLIVTILIVWLRKAL